MFLLNLPLRGTVTIPKIFEETILDTHIQGRNTVLELQYTGHNVNECYIPSRDRRIKALTVHGSQTAELLSELDSLEARYVNRNQAQKYAEIQKGLDDHLYVLDVMGSHCGCGILVKGVPLYSYAIHCNQGTSLFMSDYDLALTLRRAAPGKYWLFRFPVVTVGSLFWSTEALCAKWWRWSKRFDRDLLKCMGALELFLFERRLEVSDGARQRG